MARPSIARIGSLALKERKLGPKIMRSGLKQLSVGKVPRNAWDSHMHIVDPQKFPLAADAQYTPTAHLLSDAMRFEKAVGIRNIVLVQPSIYGYDNTCLLDGLRQLGRDRARGVVVFDPEAITQVTLREWHHLGVRGVRINLKSVGKSLNPSELAAILQQYADLVRPLGWVLELYDSLPTAIALEEIVPSLGVKVCLDHFGSPILPRTGAESLDPYLVAGFGSLVKLLEQGSTYVKMSAPYRITKDGREGLEPLAKELLRVAGMNRVVFATDWPHTRFDGLDIQPFIQQVMDWCGDDEVLLDRVFRANAEELWR